MEEVRIVRVQEKYIESYWKTLYQVATERKYLYTTKGFTLEDTTEFVTAHIKSREPDFFAVTDDDQVVGWCDIAHRKYDIFQHIGVLSMGLLSEYRGKGIGTRLLETTIKSAQKKGVEKIEIDVFASNMRAISLLKKFEFFEEGRRLKSAKIDGVYDDMVMMGKFLNKSLEPENI